MLVTMHIRPRPCCPRWHSILNPISMHMSGAGGRVWEPLLLLTCTRPGPYASVMPLGCPYVRGRSSSSQHARRHRVPQNVDDFFRVLLLRVLLGVLLVNKRTRTRTMTICRLYSTGVCVHGRGRAGFARVEPTTGYVCCFGSETTFALLV